MLIGKYYVYEWFIKDTLEVFYVGKGSGNRIRHLSNRSAEFKSVLAKYDCDARILYDNLDEEEAYEKEREVIAWYQSNTSYSLLNKTNGGQKGFIHRPETLEKISVASKSKWENKEWKERIIRNRHSPTSTYQSEGFKRKISSLVRGENNPNYGHRWTNEMKERLRKKRIGMYAGAKNPKAKKIRCVETGEVFDCIKQAQEKYGVKNGTSFSAALDKPNRTAARLHWATISSD